MKKIDLDKHYKIRDGIDIYLIGNDLITIYYMSSRLRKTFRVSKPLVELLENLDGRRVLRDLIGELSSRNDFTEDRYCSVLEKMWENRILTVCDDLHHSVRDKRFVRQVNYLSDFFEDEKSAVMAQEILSNKRISIFGCGAVGGDIALLLCMAGVRHFLLIDDDTMEESDISRHMYFREIHIGSRKIKALCEELKRINERCVIQCYPLRLEPETTIDDIISRSDFAVNTMDEPYIGYTSSKISRICFQYGLAHYIAGGFDAHLASTGELIIPYETPCVECYAEHFKKALVGWKPRKHPVQMRYQEIGGLAAMSLFSASYAAISIIKFLCGIQPIQKIVKGRGELLFNDMSLNYLDVKRNPGCPICGGHYES